MQIGLEVGGVLLILALAVLLVRTWLGCASCAGDLRRCSTWTPSSTGSGPTVMT